jgi:hypothetical protein
MAVVYTAINNEEKTEKRPARAWFFGEIAEEICELST